MSKFKAEILSKESNCWYGESFPEHIKAESEEEALEFAKDYIQDELINSKLDSDEIEKEMNDMSIRVIEIKNETETEMEK